jgi:hypothetical protein
MSDEKRMDEAEFLRIFRSLPDGLPVDAEKALADWKRARAQESALRAEVERKDAGLKRIIELVCGAGEERTNDAVEIARAALHPSAPTPATEAKKFPPHRPVGSPVQPPRVGKMRCCWDHENGVDASRPCGPTPPETTETRGEEP